MFGSEVLEIAIGLALIYLLLSIIVTGITEAVARLTALRAKNLHKGIKNLLDDYGDEALIDDFYNSSLIKSFTQPGKRWRFFDIWHWKGERRPSYITNETFHSSLVSLLREKSNETDLSKIIDKLRNDPDLLKGSPNLRKNVIDFFDEAEQDVNLFKVRVEKWFDDGMVRVTGWYKREAHTWSLIIAAFVAISLNASTINIAEDLWLNGTQRATLAGLAAKVVDDSEFKFTGEKQTDAAAENTQKALKMIKKNASLPLGWQNIQISKWNPTEWVSHLLGWLITAFALSLGAPFWFEILKKNANLRTAGANPAEKPSTPSS